MYPHEYESKRKFKWDKLSHMNSNLLNLNGVIAVEYDFSNLESRKELGITIEYDNTQLYSNWGHVQRFISDRIFSSCRTAGVEPIMETVEDYGTHYKLIGKIRPEVWFPEYEKEMII